jgi:glycosyltransferase involved in cell wall biosynthesis
MVAYTQYPQDTRVRREAEALVERGDTVDMLCLQGENEPEHEAYRGVHLTRIPVGRYRGSNVKLYMVSYLQFFLAALLKLAKLQLQNKYQVIQVHTMPDFMVFVAVFPKLLGAKILLDVHDLMPELYQSKFGYSDRHWLIRLVTWMERLSIAFAHQAIAVHKPHLEALRRHGNPAEKFTLLMNLADMRIFGRESDGRRRHESGFKLIYHGTVSKRHGLEIAVRAVGALRREIDGLQLRIFGEGDDITRLIDLVEELSLRDVVQISRGIVPLDEMVDKIRDADVGIVPILCDGFTKYMLPVKLLEYVALGMPVICSRTETIESYFDDSMVQFASPGSIPELTESILLLYRCPDRRKELSANASKFNAVHSWEKQKRSYYQLIDRLLAD